MGRSAQQDPRSNTVAGSFDRIIYTERFLKRPGINANQDASTADTYNTVQMQLIIDKNHDFEILGTNMTSTLTTFAAAGGITLTTAGASADQGILLPHLNSAASCWTSTLWTTDNTPTFDVNLTTAASIAAITIWAGFKLTNTPVVATDDDQVFFRYDDTVNNGNWQLVWSNNNVDYTLDTGIAVVASTTYALSIQIDAALVIHAFINGNEINPNTSRLIKTAKNFIPYVGVQANTAAAKALTVRTVTCTRG